MLTAWCPRFRGPSRLAQTAEERQALAWRSIGNEDSKWALVQGPGLQAGGHKNHKMAGGVTPGRISSTLVHDFRLLSCRLRLQLPFSVPF